MRSPTVVTIFSTAGDLVVRTENFYTDISVVSVTNMRYD